MKATDYDRVVGLAEKGDEYALRNEARRIYYSTPRLYNEYEGRYYDGADALNTILSRVNSERYHGTLSRDTESIITKAFGSIWS